MLKIYFFNVGDGDSQLLSLTRPGQADFNVLIDTGRPEMGFNPRSKRALSTEHLKELNVDHIDVMIITHLHIDHMGNALEIARQIPIYKAVVPYIPSGRFMGFPPADPKDPHGEKWPEFCSVLKLWQDALDCLKSNGCSVKLVWEEPIINESGLRIENIIPDSRLKEQTAFFNSLCEERLSKKDLQTPIDPSWYRISKLKNPDSLMELVSYEGHKILFCGDRYTSLFEDWQLGECEIVKLPHHGDPQAMTEKLAEKLKPEYAIISCQLDPRKGKDRPNNEILELLQGHGVKIFCTENRELPAKKESTCRRIEVIIDRETMIINPA